jgi:glyoxylase-like metal-dependent hydrolase (beta-lactamase superfamily II)
MAERYGVENPGRHLLIENLKKLGKEPGDIDLVILSHLHFDHAGGILPTYQEIEQGNDQLVFSKAQYWVGANAWERALHPHARDRASFIPGLTDKLQKTGRLTILRSNADIPKPYQGVVEILFTEGHTPGQMHTLIKSGKQPVFFCGDLIPGVPWVHIPITMGYDRFPEQLINEKMTIYQSVMRDNWLLFFTHDPNVPAATVLENNGRFQAIPVKQPLQHLPI